MKVREVLLTDQEVNDRLDEVEQMGDSIPDLLRKMQWRSATGDGAGSGRVTFTGVAFTDLPQVAAALIERQEKSLSEYRKAVQAALNSGRRP